MDLMNPQRLLWSTAAAAAVQLIGMRCSLLMPMAQIVSVPTVDGYGDIMTYWTYGVCRIVSVSIRSSWFGWRWRQLAVLFGGRQKIFGARARDIKIFGGRYGGRPKIRRESEDIGGKSERRPALR